MEPFLPAAYFLLTKKFEQILYIIWLKIPNSIVV